MLQFVTLYLIMLNTLSLKTTLHIIFINRNNKATCWLKTSNKRMISNSGNMFSMSARSTLHKYVMIVTLDYRFNILQHTHASAAMTQERSSRSQKGEKSAAVSTRRAYINCCETRQTQVSSRKPR